MTLSMAAALGLLLVNQPLLRAEGLRRDVVVAIGQDAELKEGDTAPQVVVIGGNAKIDGAVDDAVVVIGGDVEINNAVGGDVVVVGGTLHLGPKAAIRHNLSVVGGKTEIADGATVRGETQEVAIGLPFQSMLRLDWLRSWLTHCALKFRPLSLQVGWVWWFEAAFVLVYFLIAVLFPHPVQCCVNQLTARPATTFAVGILTKVMFPVIFFALAVTVIGLIVVPFLVVAAFLGLLVGKVAMLEYIGSKIGGPFGLQTGQKVLAAFVLGAVLITLLYLVPVLGWLTALVFSFWGFGAAVTACWIALRRESRSPAPASPPPAAPPLSGSPLPAEPPAAAPAITIPPAVSFPRAGFWERMGAGFLDLALLSLVAAVIGPFTLLAAIAYFSGMWAWKGTTVGGIVLNLHVVREDGHALTFLPALVRSLAAVFSVLALFLGFFWIGWDSQKQGWHDKIAGTVVVRLPRPISLVCF